MSKSNARKIIFRLGDEKEIRGLLYDAAMFTVLPFFFSSARYAHFMYDMITFGYLEDTIKYKTFFY